MTANKVYKEYKKNGGTLSFAEWIQREKAKDFLNWDARTSVPVNKPLTDSISDVLNKIQRDAGYKEAPENKYILGIHRNILIGIGVVALVGVGYLVYKKSTKQ
jgi:hypothetical protein